MEPLTPCRKRYQSRVEAADRPPGFHSIVVFCLCLVCSFLLLYLLLTKGHNLEPEDEKVANLGVKLSARCKLEDREGVI